MSKFYIARYLSYFKFVLVKIISLMSGILQLLALKLVYVIMSSELSTVKPTSLTGKLISLGVHKGRLNKLEEHKSVQTCLRLLTIFILVFIR